MVRLWRWRWGLVEGETEPGRRVDGQSGRGDGVEGALSHGEGSQSDSSR